jgi:hypothetical protein
MANEQNIYECPYGCKAQGNMPIAASIRGWKRHMTKQHGKYDQDQLDAILGAAPKDSESGKAAFLAEADQAPELFMGKEGVTTNPNPKPVKTPEEISAETKKIKTDEIGKKFSTKINKFKKSVADKIPKVLNEAVKDKGPEWQLSEEDSELLAESVENCFEILDIDFRITPVSTVLTNPLWVLILPALVLALIFGTKVVKHARAQGNTNETDNNGPKLAPEP